MTLDQENNKEIELLRQGKDEALATLFSDYEDRLIKMVRFRLDQRLWGRVDPEDIVQEAYLDISRRRCDYLRNPSVPVFIWFRSMTEQAMINVHRRHLGAKIRDVKQEISLNTGYGPLATSVALAACLAADLTSPSHAAVRAEMLDELRGAFDTMDSIDREVLALRHFEELSNNEVAALLGLQKAAASNRYVRALKRLKEVLSQLPSFQDSQVEQQQGDAHD